MQQVVEDLDRAQVLFFVVVVVVTPFVCHCDHFLHGVSRWWPRHCLMSGTGSSTCTRVPRRRGTSCRMRLSNSARSARWPRRNWPLFRAIRTRSSASSTRRPSRFFLNTQTTLFRSALRVLHLVTISLSPALFLACAQDDNVAMRKELEKVKAKLRAAEDRLQEMDSVVDNKENSRPANRIAASADATAAGVHMNK